MRKTKLLLILLFLSAQFSFSTEVTGCQEIDAEGEYTLSSNIMGANITSNQTQVCILISNSSVVLDCAGYNISNDVGGQTVSGNVTGILIEGGEEELINVTVKNCFLSNYSWGITTYRVNDSVIENNSVRFSERIAIELINSTGINVTNNTVYTNPGDGFSFFHSHHNRFENNSAWNNTYGFISQNDSTYNIFLNNSAWNNTYGFVLHTANYTLVTNNTAWNNTINGFELYLSHYNNLTYNVAYDHNYTNYSYVNYGDGFYLSNSTYNILDNNTAYQNSGSGFVLYGSEYNNLTNNIAVKNYWNGFYLYSSYENLFINNSAYETSQYGFNIYLGYGNNLTNNTAQESGYFDLYTDPFFWEIIEPSEANTIYCSNTIENLSGSGGRQVYYTNSTAGSDGNFEASEVLMCGASGFSLDNITVRGSDNIPNNGVVIVGSNMVAVNNSNSSGNMAGFFVLSSNTTILYNNTAQDNLLAGFAAFLSAGTTFDSNTQSGSAVGGFISIVNNNTNFYNNTVYNNTIGILVEEDQNAYLKGNTVYGSNLSGVIVQYANNTFITNDHYYGNDVDIIISSYETYLPADSYLPAYPIIVNLSGVVFDNPSGSFENYTNISINDLVENETGYSITWTTQPSPLPSRYRSIGNKFLNLQNSNSSIDEIIWHWTDEESSGYNENRFAIIKYVDDVGWGTIPGQARDIAANKIMLSDLDDFSVFTLVEKPESTSTGGGSSCLPNPKISVEQICPGDRILVRVADNENNSVGADQLVVLTAPDGRWYAEDTNKNGEVSFTLQREGSYTVKSQGRYCGEYEFTYSMCQIGCQSNSSCGDGEYCDVSSGECKSVNCPCGEISNHTCHPYACCADTDCGQGYVCANHECKLKTIEPQCRVDADCKDEEYCRNGNCTLVEVGECGYAANHRWYGYECCSNADCKPNQICENHACLLCRILTDPTGIIGTQHEVRVVPAGKYTLRIITPSGETKQIDTDTAGTGMFTLEKAGEYAVSLVGIAANVTVNAIAEEKPPSPPSAPLTELCLPAIGILLFIAVLYTLYRRASRR